MGNILFGTISDPGQWVYHYTSLETALERLLPSGSLRLGPFALVNDPREAKAWLFSITARYDGPDADEFQELQKRATSLVKDHCKILCVGQDDPRSVSDPANHLFHRGYARPRMWAQYGGGHRGVCLVLDRAALNASIEEGLAGQSRLYAGPVEYRNFHPDDYRAFDLDYEDLRSSTLEAVLQAQVDTFYRTFFFTKAEDWSSEIEWRWVLSGSNDEPVYVSLGSSLKAIVLGVDFPHEYDPAVVPFGKQFQVHIGRMHWRNGTPSVVQGTYDPSA